jgi:hypothetical protein
MKEFIATIIFVLLFGSLSSQPSQRIYVQRPSGEIEVQINYPRIFGDVIRVDIYDSSKLEGSKFHTKFEFKDKKIISCSFFDKHKIKQTNVKYYGDKNHLKNIEIYNVIDGNEQLSNRFEFRQINNDSFIIFSYYILPPEEILLSLESFRICDNSIRKIHTTLEEEVPVGKPTIKTFSFKDDKIIGESWNYSPNGYLKFNKTIYEYNDFDLISSQTYYLDNKFVDKHNYLYTYDKFNNWTKLEVYNSIDNLVKTVHRKITYTKDTP